MVVLRDPTLVAEEPVSRLYGTLLSTRKHRGTTRVLAHLWRFEKENNPDAQVGNPLFDSNPVDVYADRKGFVVADAGGNSLLRVYSRTAGGSASSRCSRTSRRRTRSAGRHSDERGADRRGPAGGTARTT